MRAASTSLRSRGIRSPSLRGCDRSSGKPKFERQEMPPVLDLAGGKGAVLIGRDSAPLDNNRQKEGEEGDVHDAKQMMELHALDARMAAIAEDKRTNTHVVDTLTFLRGHHADHTSGRQGRSHAGSHRHSTSFIHAIVDVFLRATHRLTSQEKKRDEDQLQGVQEPWGQEVLGCEWSEVSFQLLNQALLNDSHRVRDIIAKGELICASPMAITLLAKWLQLFDRHVCYVLTLKEYLSEERMALATTSYQSPSVAYDDYRRALRHALAQTHCGREDLGAAIIEMLDALESTLKDELQRTRQVVEESLTPTKEYEALRNLLFNADTQDPCGMIFAKILGWMRSHMDDAEIDPYLASFHADVQNSLVGEWMRQYASHLHLLDQFPINYFNSIAYVAP